MADAGELRVGIIGTAFMGAAHSHAWATAPKFFDLPRQPVLQVMAGRDAERARATAARFGWHETTTDWRELVEREDVDLVDICSPGDTHVEIALAALAAGKHVLCEKPLANSVAEAEQMTEAAAAAAERGVLAMCGFTYRRVPALALARQLVAEGRLGEIRHVRAQYLQDWLSDPDAPLTWRMDRSVSGSGALGDIGAHVIDATQWVTGQSVTGVSALLQTFVHDRPYSSGQASGLSRSEDGRTGRGPVTVDDAALFTARFEGGAVGSFEATRFALGRKNAIRIEVNGSLGSLSFDFEDMNVLHFFDGSTPSRTQGFTRIVVTEADHPYTASWWPPGHGLGYEHSFTHQVVDLVSALAAGEQPRPSFADALAVQRVMDAVERSAADDSRWTVL
ncbi:Gfo/Idh/MocA family protein [uncultured Friedmanniella sp.]|uniref:Gfo/Idh/MocA family protein n=1 Tax=uncultured Friedmanniella sp. TaxID=335381 RepID=UPI0035CC7B40